MLHIELYIKSTSMHTIDPNLSPWKVIFCPVATTLNISLCCIRDISKESSIFFKEHVVRTCDGTKSFSCINIINFECRGRWQKCARKVPSNAHNRCFSRLCRKLYRAFFFFFSFFWSHYLI